MPSALWHTVDPYPSMPPEKKKKFFESLSQPGVANCEVRPAFTYLASLVIGNGQPWDSVARGLTFAMAARSVLLDAEGQVVPPQLDPYRMTNQAVMRAHSENWLKIVWTSGPLAHDAITDIREAVAFCFHRCLRHSESYFCPPVQRGVKRQFNESLTYIDSAVAAITVSMKAEPEHLRWWHGNKSIYTFLYPFFAEHVLGRPIVTDDTLRADVNTKFAVPPMAAPYTPPPPPPPPPALTLVPSSSPSTAPPVSGSAPRYLPPVPPFTAGATVAQLYPARRRGTTLAPTAQGPVPGLRTFAGRPCSPSIVGHDIGIALPPARAPCACAASKSLPSPHRIWECPLNYFAKFGSCPGFLPSGDRDPAAWSHLSSTSSLLLPATRTAWKTFIATHKLDRAKDAPADVAF